MKKPDGITPLLNLESKVFGSGGHPRNDLRHVGQLQRQAQEHPGAASPQPFGRRLAE